MMVGDTTRLSFDQSDKVVAVRAKNQGTVTMLTGWNSESTSNQILAGTSETFDAGDSAYMEGALLIRFNSGGTASGIILILKDSPDNCD